MQTYIHVIDIALVLCAVGDGDIQEFTHRLLGMHEGPIDLDLKVPRDARVLDLREANVLRKTSSKHAFTP